MNQSFDVCIIGAGASGLAAANSIDPRLKTAIIDKNSIPGRKILATGGGRCNLTNEACPRLQMTLDFFHGLGLEIFSDGEGRYYPYSQNASDVVEILMKDLKKRDIEWFFEREVTNIAPVKGEFSEGGKEDGKEEGFSVRIKNISKNKKASDEDDTIFARKVILSPGGKAAPAFGTTGSGYALAKKTGHGCSRVYPILTGINCRLPEGVPGIRARGTVTLVEDGAPVETKKGEIQFTKEGISGICVFDLTPHIKARPGEDPRDAFKRYKVIIDFAPDFSREEVSKRESSFGIVTEALARWVPPDKLKNMEIPVEGVWGWDKAQATGGGVLTESIDMETMESRICPGLFFAGEILDIQGPCGGFNLQNAWETGIIAGRSVSEQMLKP